MKSLPFLNKLLTNTVALFFMAAVYGLIISNPDAVHFCMFVVVTALLIKIYMSVHFFAVWFVHAYKPNEEGAEESVACNDPMHRPPFVSRDGMMEDYSVPRECQPTLAYDMQALREMHKRENVLGTGRGYPG